MSLNDRIEALAHDLAKRESVHIGAIEKARQKYPDVKVVVHPECLMEVLEAADMDGSTEFITKTITNAEPGTTWVQMQEIHAVENGQVLPPFSNDQTL